MADSPFFSTPLIGAPVISDLDFFWKKSEGRGSFSIQKFNCRFFVFKTVYFGRKFWRKKNCSKRGERDEGLQHLCKSKYFDLQKNYEKHTERVEPLLRIGVTSRTSHDGFVNMTVDYYTLCVVDSALKYHGVHCVQYDKPKLKRKAQEGGSAVQYSHLQWGGSTQCTMNHCNRREYSPMHKSSIQQRHRNTKQLSSKAQLVIFINYSAFTSMPDVLVVLTNYMHKTNYFLLQNISNRFCSDARGCKRKILH